MLSTSSEVGTSATSLSGKPSQICRSGGRPTARQAAAHSPRRTDPRVCLVAGNPSGMSPAPPSVAWTRTNRKPLSSACFATVPAQLRASSSGCATTTAKVPFTSSRVPRCDPRHTSWLSWSGPDPLALHEVSMTSGTSWRRRRDLAGTVDLSDSIAATAAVPDVQGPGRSHRHAPHTRGVFSCDTPSAPDPGHGQPPSPSGRVGQRASTWPTSQAYVVAATDSPGSVD